MFSKRKQEMERAIAALKSYYGIKYKDFALGAMGDTGTFDLAQSDHSDLQGLGDFFDLNIGRAANSDNEGMGDGELVKGRFGTSLSGLAGNLQRPAFTTLQQATDLAISDLRTGGAYEGGATPPNPISKQAIEAHKTLENKIQAQQLSMGRNLMDIGFGFLANGEIVPTTAALNDRFVEFGMGIPETRGLAARGDAAAQDAYEAARDAGKSDDEQDAAGLAAGFGDNMSRGNLLTAEARILGMNILPFSRFGFGSADHTVAGTTNTTNRLNERVGAMTDIPTLQAALSVGQNIGYTMMSAQITDSPARGFSELCMIWPFGVTSNSTTDHPAASCNDDNKTTFSITQLVSARGRQLQAPINVVCVTNPMFDPSLTDTDSVEMMMNAIPTTELSKAIPFLNIEFMTSKSKKGSHSIQGVTSSSYLLGLAKPKNTAMKDFVEAPFLNENVVGASIKELVGSETEEARTIKKSGMEVFTSPQTMVGVSPGNQYLRPFMSIQDFTVKATAPELGKGQSSCKITGTLKLVIHDKSKMHLVADMLKVGGFRAGEPIRITYGWAHPDANVKSHPSTSQRVDYLYGRLIDGQRVTSVFDVINSAFDVSASGEVTATIEMISLGSTSETLSIDCLEHFSQDILVNKRPSAVLMLLEELGEALLRAYPVQRIPTLFQPDVLATLANELQDEQGLFIAYPTVLVIKALLHKIKQAPADQLPPIADIAALQIAIIEQLEASLSAGGATELKKGKVFVLTKGRPSLPKDRVKMFVDYMSHYAPGFSHKFNLAKKKASKEAYNKAAKAGKGTAYVARQLATGNSAFMGLGLDAYAAPRLSTHPKVNGANVGFDPDLFNISQRPSAGTIRFMDLKQKKKLDYITLGTLFEKLVLGPISLHTVGKVHEIQCIYHGFNESAGAQHDSNIASFPIKMSKFSSTFQKAYIAGKGMSVEELIHFILDNFVNNEKSPAYGIVGTGMSARKSLNKIYGYDENFPSPQFTLPKVRVQFSLKQGTVKMGSTDPSHTTKLPILRVELFDESSGPQNVGKRFLDARSNGGLYMKKTRRVDPFNKSLITAASFACELGRRGMNHQYYSFIAESLFAGLLKSVPDRIITHIKKRSKGKLEGHVLDAIATHHSFLDCDNTTIKRVLQLAYPSIIYGAANSGVLNAKIASKKAGDDKDLAISRRNKQSNAFEKGKIDAAFQQELVFQTHPVDVSIETIGCPFFNFMQKYYIDFGTNTTIDNVYTVTNVTHTIAAGQFKSSVDFKVLEKAFQYNSLYGSAAKIVATAIAHLNHVDGFEEEGRPAAPTDIRDNQIPQ